ncbi:MAG: hypothetical protein DRQ40_03840 [Gammaproteobacteria bacterium]|nr:MAG: hypothetical protein DRQ40_03840 [Gammaproteobacteria bacterium]
MNKFETALNNYGPAACLAAYNSNRIEGNGVNTIAIDVGFAHTNQVHAAINAWEWLTENPHMLELYLKDLLNADRAKMQTLREKAILAEANVVAAEIALQNAAGAAIKFARSAASNYKKYCKVVKANNNKLEDVDFS